MARGSAPRSPFPCTCELRRCRVAQNCQTPSLASAGMDLNAFWGLVESSAAGASSQDDRLHRLTAAPASRGLELLVWPDPVGESWEFADPAGNAAGVPRWGALFGKVA